MPSYEVYAKHGSKSYKINIRATNREAAQKAANEAVKKGYVRRNIERNTFGK